MHSRCSRKLVAGGCGVTLGSTWGVSRVQGVHAQRDCDARPCSLSRRRLLTKHAGGRLNHRAAPPPPAPRPRAGSPRPRHGPGWRLRGSSWGAGGSRPWFPPGGVCVLLSCHRGALPSFHLRHQFGDLRHSRGARAPTRESGGMNAGRGCGAGGPPWRPGSPSPYRAGGVGSCGL